MTVLSPIQSNRRFSSPPAKGGGLDRRIRVEKATFLPAGLNYTPYCTTSSGLRSNSITHAKNSFIVLLFGLYKTIPAYGKAV